MKEEKRKEIRESDVIMTESRANAAGSLSMSEHCCSKADAILVKGASLDLLDLLEALIECAGYRPSDRRGLDLIFATGARGCARGCV